MTPTELKKLRAFYHSLVAQQRIFEDAAGKHPNVEGAPVHVLSEELVRISNDFPGLVPTFEAERFLSHRSDTGAYYKVSGIRSYLGVVIARVKVAMDAEESSPVIERMDFLFIADQELQTVLERDYSEIQRSFVARCWKSVIILSGGAIEAILLDTLLENQERAKASGKAPREPDLRKWDLSDLINVSVEQSLVSPGVEKLSHSVRDYRNLVHPGNEIRIGLTFDAEEARIAIEVLRILCRDLSK